MYKYFCRVNSQKKNFWAKVCAHIQSFDRSCQIAFKELYYFPCNKAWMRMPVFSHTPQYCIESTFIIFIIWYFNDIGTSPPWLTSLVPTEPSCEMIEQKHTGIALPMGMFDSITWICHGTWGPTRSEEVRLFFYQVPIYQWIEHFSQGLWDFWLSQQAYSLSRKKALCGEWQVFSVISEVNAKRIWIGHQPCWL